MNREIKFKYIVIRENGFKFHDSFTLSQIQEGRAKSWMERNGVTESILHRCEFIGLQDKNGRDIYNGDVVHKRKNGDFYEYWIVKYGSFGDAKYYVCNQINSCREIQVYNDSDGCFAEIR